MELVQKENIFQLLFDNLTVYSAKFQLYTQMTKGIVLYGIEGPRMSP